MELDPKLVSSSYAGPVTRKGVTVRLEIYRLDDGLQWVLEVVNENGTSTVCDEMFDMDSAAYAAFQSTAKDEGMSAFLDKTSGVPPLTRH